MLLFLINIIDSILWCRENNNCQLLVLLRQTVWIKPRGQRTKICFHIKIFHLNRSQNGGESGSVENIFLNNSANFTCLRLLHEYTTLPYILALDDTDSTVKSWLLTTPTLPSWLLTVPKPDTPTRTRRYTNSPGLHQLPAIHRSPGVTPTGGTPHRFSTMAQHVHETPPNSS